MFQAVEMTENRSVWIDTPIETRGLGFLNSTRVEIVLNPQGVSDWKEPGDCYKCTLVQGLWPDNHELALMVLGYSPGSKEADQFLNSLVDAMDDFLGEAKDALSLAKSRLLDGMSVMPAWDGGNVRELFVTHAFTRGTAQDDAPNLQRTATAQPRSAQQMGFDEWHLMLDLELSKRKSAGQSTISLSEDAASMEDLRTAHSEGVTVEQYATALVSAPAAQGTEQLDVDEDAGP